MFCLTIFAFTCSLKNLDAQTPAQPDTLVVEFPEAAPPENLPLDEPSVEQNNVREEFVPDPSKAWRYSAILPGLGQAYNRSFWKIPIIYAGFGAVVIVYNFNNRQFHRWRNAYIAKLDPNLPDEFPHASVHAIRNLMDTYRRYREFTVLAGVAVYLFNILEAYVHAHLLNFDVSEDLSLRLDPSLQPVNGQGWASGGALGLKLTFNF